MHHGDIRCGRLRQAEAYPRAPHVPQYARDAGEKGQPTLGMFLPKNTITRQSISESATFGHALRKILS